MDNIQLILKYFPDLTESQQRQFESLGELYAEWNSKINVISRKDIDHLYEKHVLHSLGIAKIMAFKPGHRVLDVGTGGGFPGIPLAILFPETDFVLVDTIQKKIRVVDAVASSIGLDNVDAIHQRAEKVKGQYDFVVSRAVTRMKPFYQWVQNKIKPGNNNEKFSNGILYLKGGDLEEEMNELNRPYQIFDLDDHFTEPFFLTKKVVYVPK